MRKRIMQQIQPDVSLPSEDDWLKVEDLAEVEVTSEDTAHPIDSALLPHHGPGWRAAEPGPQTVRLVFARPQQVRRIQLNFLEPTTERTQEYVLRWSPNAGRSFQEIVRQQWNFSPQGATSETEDHNISHSEVTILEISIIPDLTRRTAIASMAQLRLA
jgi:hypothetical protein